MIRPIVWTDEAMADLDELFTQIVLESPQGALLVDDRIHFQVELLSRFPFLGRVSRIAGENLDVRDLVIHKTSYVVTYQVEQDAVRILRILHGARDWQGQS